MMDQLITILGPTASGKTTLAANLAALINGEIISADSRQLYRGMDIGTGKDIGEYIVNGTEIPHHLIDILDPGTRYNVFEYMAEFNNAYKSIIENNRFPILCGGSGMYLDAVLRGYQMSKVTKNSKLREQMNGWSTENLVKKLKSYGPLHNISDISDVKRLIRAIEIADYQSQNRDNEVSLPKFTSMNFGISYDRSEIRLRITERLSSRLSDGLVGEVEGLLKMGIVEEDLIYYGLEYKFVTMYVTGKISYDSMFTQLNTAIHQFAKRQMTWFRRMEKKGVKIYWIDGSIDIVDKLAVILHQLKRGN